MTPAPTINGSTTTERLIGAARILGRAARELGPEAVTLVSTVLVAGTMPDRSDNLMAAVEIALAMLKLKPEEAKAVLVEYLVASGWSPDAKPVARRRPRSSTTRARR